MKSFKVETLIQATPDTVWRILTDASGWKEWNTTIDRIEGRIELGGKVKVYPKISPGRAFPVLVSEFTAPRKMIWTGGMPMGLFKGERTYTLTPQGNAVKFVMEENFTGLLSPVIGRSIPNMQPVFEEFASALKKRAESDRRSA